MCLWHKLQPKCWDCSSRRPLPPPATGTPAKGGFLFDRLEEVLGWGDMLPGMPPAPPLPAPAAATPPATGGRSAAAAAAAAAAPPPQQAGAAREPDGGAPTPGIVTCCLARRRKPERNPPRIVVLCGPGAVGKGALARQLVAESPDRFGLTVSTTTRQPREHEVDGRCVARSSALPWNGLDWTGLHPQPFGDRHTRLICRAPLTPRDFFFTDKHTLLASIKSKAFLEAARRGATQTPPGACGQWASCMPRNT
jgi:hypothetical protein